MATRTNYIGNPSFEVDLAGWTEYNPSASVSSWRDTSEAAPGAGSAALRINNNIAADYGRKKIESLEPGTYTASAHLHVLPGTTNVCFVVRRRSDLLVLVEQHLTSPNNGMQRLSGVFSLAVTTEVEILLGVGSYGAASAGSVRCDGILIESGATLGPYFDGATTSDATWTYSWWGTAQESRSTATTTGSPTPTPTPSPGSPPITGFNPTPVFFDQFTESSLDLNTWGLYGPGPGTNGEGTMDPTHVRTTGLTTAADSGGQLVIFNTGTTGGGLAKRAGRRYGRWEVRAAVEKGKGIGPAILLWPDSDDQNDGEIDLFECANGLADHATFTVHQPGNPKFGLKQYTQPLNASQWHVYAVDWLPDRITYYIDGQKVYEVTDKAFIPTTPFHLAMQLDSGIPGGALGIPPRDSSSPGTLNFFIDYVKIYEPTTTSTPTSSNLGWSLVDSDDFSTGSTPASRWTQYDNSGAAPSLPVGAWNLYSDPNSQAAGQLGSISDPIIHANLQWVVDQHQSYWSGYDWDRFCSGLSGYISACNTAGKRGSLVLYSVPIRDNNGASRGGAPDWTAYQSWIVSAATAIGSATCIVIVEPDAVTLSTGLSASDQADRKAGLTTALAYLSAHCPNAFIVLDAGHSQWLSGAYLAQLLKDHGIANCDGFSGDVSSYRRDGEILPWAQDLVTQLGTLGVSGMQFVIDTGRNGATHDLDPQDWENAVGACFGKTPLAGGPSVTGVSNMFARLWVKRPGESDGNEANSVTPNGHGAPGAGQLWMAYLLDMMIRPPTPGLPAEVTSGELQLHGISNVAKGLTAATSQHYGRWEIKTIIPDGVGYVGTVALKSGTSTDGEIRLFQSPSDGSASNNTLYVRKPGSSSTLTQVVTADLNQPHLWAVEWLPTGLTFYLDGVQVWQVTDTTYLPSVPFHMDVKLDYGTPDSNTPQPFVFHLDDFKVFTPASGSPTPTPTNTALEQKVRNVWAGIKHRYIRVDGAVMQKDADNKVVSEGQGYALKQAVTLDDRATFDLVESFCVSTLERQNNPATATVGGSLMAWDYRVNPFNSNPANTVNDWNFATDADVDRGKANLWAYKRWGDIKYLNKALAIARDLWTFAMAISANGNVMQMSDAYQKIVNGNQSGHHLNGSSQAVGEMNASYIDIAWYNLIKDIGNDSRWDAATAGALDVYTKVTDNSGTLATSKGLFPDWNEWNFATNTPDALTSGVDGWTYSRATDQKYDGFRAPVRAVWAYDWYKTSQIPTILASLAAFYAAEWAAQSKISAEYGHDGTRLSGGYEKSIMTEVAVMVLTCNDPSNATAAAIKAAKLNPDTQYAIDSEGYGYWYDGPGGGGSSYFSDFWNNFYYLREAGLWQNFGQSTPATGAVTLEVVDVGTSTDTADLSIAIALVVVDQGKSTDTIDSVGDVSLIVDDKGSSVDIGDELTVPSIPEPAPPPPPPVVIHERWVWIATDGTQLELSRFVDNLAVVKGMSGRGAPPVVVKRVVVPGQPGERTTSIRHGVRSMPLPLFADAASWPDLQALLDKVINYMDPLDGAGTLRYIGLDGHVSDLFCRCVSGLTIDNEGANGPAAHQLDLVFEADDPYFYRDTITESWVGTDAVKWFPILPLSLGSSAIIGDTTLDTRSDVEVWPVWTIVGPGQAPVLTNKTTNKTISFKDGASLDAVQVLTIDTRPGTLSTTPKSVLGPDGSSWRRFLDRRSLWSLAKGQNQLSLGLPGSTASSYISVAFRPRTKRP
jgi:beta-glucanase (GH16 family)/endo-1,4-beta-D-glucanase Y